MTYGVGIANVGCIILADMTDIMMFIIYRTPQNPIQVCNTDRCWLIFRPSWRELLIFFFFKGKMAG